MVFLYVFNYTDFILRKKTGYSFDGVKYPKSWHPSLPISIPSSMCSAILNQFIGHRLCSTSQYIKKEFSPQKCQLTFPQRWMLKCTKNLLIYLSADPDNRSWLSTINLLIVAPPRLGSWHIKILYIYMDTKKGVGVKMSKQLFIN